MPFDPGLAERIRDVMAERHDVVEKRMFGGIAFMVSGHMCCGVATEDLMVRVGPDRYAEALAHPHAREMDFTRKPLKGYVYVAPAGLEDAVKGKLETACKGAIDSKPFQDRMATLKQPSAYLGAGDFAAFVHEKYETNRKLLEKAGLLAK